MMQHFVNLSGGKDSGATLELALMSGRPFVAIMADTGNENDVTWQHVGLLSERLVDHGRDPVQVVKADFTDRIARKREYVRTKWPEKGVDQATIDRALETLHPTGNPFLDLCIWKGRFPSKMAQFCTEFLKAEAIEQQVIQPALKCGPVAQWLGVRRDESLARRDAPMFQRVRTEAGTILYYRPIIHWTAQNVIAFAQARGAPINPLYSEGMGRVGCFPCINASKGELAQIARRYPEAFERIAAWEAIVADASKRQKATFFAGPVTPEGAAMAREEKRLKRLGLADPGFQYPRAPAVAEWSKTDRGGRQYNWMRDAEAEDEGVSCSSMYGLCE